MNTKFVMLWIIGIVAISLVTVIAETSITGQITGDVVNYGAASKLYGPSLRKAQERNLRLAMISPQQIDTQRYQGQILANKDKLVCGGSPDGPTPCMWFEDKNKWCCLPQSQDTMKYLTKLEPRKQYTFSGLAIK